MRMLKKLIELISDDFFNHIRQPEEVPNFYQFHLGIGQMLAPGTDGATPNNEEESP